MVIGIYMHIFAAQIASIAKIVVFSNIQIHRDLVFRLCDNFGDRFCVKMGRCSVAENKDVADFTRQLGRIQFNPGRADRADNAAPVGITTMNGTFN